MMYIHGYNFSLSLVVHVPTSVLQPLSTWIFLHHWVGHYGYDSMTWFKLHIGLKRQLAMSSDFDLEFTFNST